MEKEVIIYYGPMFAGKTEKLIEKMEERKKHIRYIIKNSIDTRSKDFDICTHNYLEDPIQYKNQLIVANCAIDKLLILCKVEYFCEDEDIYIDEGQFFPDLAEFVKKMRNSHNIYISALDMNIKKEMFPSVKATFELEDIQKVQLFSECSKCNEKKAIYSYLKKGEMTRDGILIGGSDLYGVICIDCDYKLTQ